MSFRNLVLLLLLILSIIPCSLAAAEPSSPPDIKVVRFTSPKEIEIAVDGTVSRIEIGDRVEDWTFMDIIDGDSKAPAFAVLEDFSTRTGHLLIVGKQGIKLDLSKSLESTAPDPTKLYLGHTLAEIKNSASDLLAGEILAKPGDPNYDEIAAIFPPIRKMDTYSFVGTRESIDKIGFEYGGRTPDFDPAPYDAWIPDVRKKGLVLDGLVGEYLPILRFVYPETPDSWTEMLAFAPPRITNDNDRIQPVWYRVLHVAQNSVQWSRYIDSYHPFPPRTEYDSKVFYRDLLKLNDTWNNALSPGLKIDIPDKRMQNMARFALVRDMMTRVGDYPKYGVVDRNYAGSEHDGFPDTFNVDTEAMLEWGYLDLAGRYIDNYFGQFVREDGSLLYRGPETGQYGRMLTVLAQFVNYGGDPNLLLKQKSRIDGVVNLLLSMRAKAKELSPENPAFGMLSGWSEADACLDPLPERYMQPYFSNSTEAARGFRDLGAVWIKIGQETKNNDLVAWGERLQRESAELQIDIQKAISRSLLKVGGETILPAIAGVQEPFHVAVPKDSTDPQFRSYRAYMEMLDSGLLTAEQVKMIVSYREHHHDTILGVPTAYGYNTGDMAGFLAYGHGYGLIQHEMIREALLLNYSVMAHQYTRGTWTAPETRSLFDDSPAAPYCTPAQLVVALMTRWIMVFEDPTSDTLWLGKAVPRQWLEDGRVVAISDAPTRWGKVGFRAQSRLNHGMIEATITLPAHSPNKVVLRLRAPHQEPLKSILLNGKPWTNFDAAQETIDLPAGSSGEVKIVARYR